MPVARQRNVRFCAASMLVGCAILFCLLMVGFMDTGHPVLGVLASLIMLGCMIAAALLAARPL